MDKPAKPARRPGSGEDESEDVVLLHGRTDDNEGYRAVRAREGRVELAEIRPARDGRPLTGSELVRLRPRPELPLLCDVEVLFRGEAPDSEGTAEREGQREAAAGTGHEGPARVTSRSYRENWDEIFRPRSRKPRGPAN